MIINWIIVSIVGGVCVLRIFFEYAQYRQQRSKLQKSMKTLTDEIARYQARSNEHPRSNSHLATLQSEKHAALQRKLDQNKSV